jgi:hypothetical protein
MLLHLAGEEKEHFLFVLDLLEDKDTNEIKLKLICEVAECNKGLQFVVRVHENNLKHLRMMLHLLFCVEACRKLVASCMVLGKKVESWRGICLRHGFRCSQR